MPQKPIVKESRVPRYAKNGTFFTQLRSNYGQTLVSRKDTDRLAIFENVIKSHRLHHRLPAVLIKFIFHGVVGTILNI